MSDPREVQRAITAEQRIEIDGDKGPSGTLETAFANILDLVALTWEDSPEGYPHRLVTAVVDEVLSIARCSDGRASSAGASRHTLPQFRL
jgi:hypothetical protein